MAPICRSHPSLSALLAALVAVTACGPGAAPDAPAPSRASASLDEAAYRTPPPRSPVEYAAGLTAKLLCSGIFVVGRDAPRSPSEVLAEDVAPFPWFSWDDAFAWDVDEVAREVTVIPPGAPGRTAEYNDDQGCTLLPPGVDDVFFEPVATDPELPDPATQAWPTGDRGARWERPPPEVDEAALEAALDRAMDDARWLRPQNTRALVVLYRGRILAERYRPPFGPHTPQLSWSQGKSVTAALVGVLVERGALDMEAPAPVAEWQARGDPRRAITPTHLLRMSSGLDFTNRGLGGEETLTRENEHFLIYFDAVHVFDHAVDQPPQVPPGTRWAYRNSDPLTLDKVVRETVEAGGGSYLTFPQRAFFDRIGIRDAVLETDAWGNFILTGYDFMSALDWARFGLLHLRDGVWEGERILPEGWVELVTTPAPADETRGYGGLFWLNRGGAWDRLPAGAYWAAGFMGQNTVVIPSRDMVVVRLGPSAGGSSAYLNDVLGDVLDAVGAGTDTDGQPGPAGRASGETDPDGVGSPRPHPHR